MYSIIDIQDKILHGDTLTQLKLIPDECVDCVVTSPPYWKQRNYKVGGQIGQESTYHEYLVNLFNISEEIKRIMKHTGSYWVNIGDTRAGTKRGNTNKFMKTGVSDMVINKTAQDIEYGQLSIPEQFKLGMYSFGWRCIDTIIWYKRNAKPEGNAAVRRFGQDFEYFYRFVKSKDYYFETQYRPLAASTLKQLEKLYTGLGRKDYEGNGVVNPSDTKRNALKSLYKSKVGNTTNWRDSSIKGLPINTGIKFGGNKHSKELGGINSGKEWTINTRPGLNTGKGKSGTPDDPNSGLHTADISKFRQVTVREIEGELKGSIMRSVWDITTKPFKGAHFAVFPPELVEIPLKSTCPSGGIVLDPFFGSGTTGLVAKKQNKHYIGIELNPDYIEIANKRLNTLQMLLE